MKREVCMRFRFPADTDVFEGSDRALPDFRMLMLQIDSERGDRLPEIRPYPFFQRERNRGGKRSSCVFHIWVLVFEDSRDHGGGFVGDRHE